MSDTSTTNRASLSWRLWQLLVIPVCYPIFVFGSLIMITLIPFAVFFFRDRTKRTRWLRAALHHGARLWVALHDILGVLEVRVDDRRDSRRPSLRGGQSGASANPPAPVLVIANHPSLIDVLLITATLPNLCCVLKGALHYNPLFTLLIRNLDYLPNSDPERMLAEGCERLLAGEQLLIFPEGTRTEPGKPLQFRMGAAELAVRSAASVLPITIHSNSPYLSKGVPWYRWPTDKLYYKLELGPLLSPTSRDLTPDKTGVNTAATPERTTIGAIERDRKSRRAARRTVNQIWRDHFHQRLKGRHVGN